MSKKDNKKIAQKRRRLAAIQRSYIFLNEWYKNDIWVGNVVHYHKQFSGQDHSFIVSRAKASARDKTIYAFDIGTGEQLCKADDILSLAGAMSTKGLEITGVDSSYKCPFKPNHFLSHHLSDNLSKLKQVDMEGISTGSIVLVEYSKKVIPYLIGYSDDTCNFLYDTSQAKYLIDLSKGIIEESAGGAEAFCSILNIIGEWQKANPVILGTLQNY